MCSTVCKLFKMWRQQLLVRLKAKNSCFILQQLREQNVLHLANSKLKLFIFTFLTSLLLAYEVVL